MAGTNKPEYEPEIPPVDYKRALVLDKETELQPTNVTAGMAWDAIKKLELRQWVNEVQWAAKKQFGQYLEVELTEGVMTTDIFEAAQAMKRNLEGFTSMATNSSVKSDVRIAAGLAAASAARSYKELIDSLNQRVKEAQTRRDPSLLPKGKRRGPPIRGPIEVETTQSPTPPPPATGGSVSDEPD